MNTENMVMGGFPRQRIPRSKKNKGWMKKCIDYASSFAYPNSEVMASRRSHIMRNRELLKPDGTISSDEYMKFVNPSSIKAKYVPKTIEHYNVMNSPLHILEGEEAGRPFEYKVLVTNYNGISEVEESKMNDAMSKLMAMVQDPNMTEEEYQNEVGKLEDYYKYSYQDIREIWANCILKHYSLDDNFSIMFNKGFFDSFSSAWEIYDVSNSGSEPYIRWVDPSCVTVMMSKNSCRVEDAMIVTHTTYMHISEIIDSYSGDDGSLKGLSDKDIEKLEKLVSTGAEDYSSEGYNYYRPIIEDVVNMRAGTIALDDDGNYRSERTEKWHDGNVYVSDSDYESVVGGYIKVVEVRWKSMRRIRRVKRYNQETGDMEYHIFDDSYVLDEDMGEECEEFWISDPYQGIKIGDSIYTRCGERQCKFRKIDNPSECHLGYVGSMYSFDNVTPYCLVDIMKKHAILYDVIMNKLLRFIARDNGKAVRVDLAKVPKEDGWDLNAMLYFFYNQGILFENTFNEGDKGVATGKLAGALNNNANPSVDADMSAVISQYINILTYIKSTLNELIGITPQRMGQISNRETVGGVERATLQSSHITEWLFMIHEDIKKRVCEAFIDVSKYCYAKKSKKIRAVLPEYVIKTFDIDGEYYRTADYGIVLDNTNSIKELNQRVDMLAQAAIQNNMLDFSSVLELYRSCSLAEKMVIIRSNEQSVRERMSQQQQEEMQIRQQEMESRAKSEQEKMQLDDAKNQRDNETKILIANIQKQYSQGDAEKDGISVMKSKDELMEKMRQFDETMKFNMEKLKSDEKIAKENNDTKIKIAGMKPKTSAK